MTSERKIAANRLNGRKSRGPRSAAGKHIASRNALKHGITATIHQPAEASNEIDRLAKLLCEGNDNPALFEQGRAVARSAIAIRSIEAEQIAVLERLRDPKRVAFSNSVNIDLAKERSIRLLKILDERIATRDRLIAELQEELPPLSELMEDDDDEPDPIPPPEEKVVPPIKERDDAEALEEAAVDLIRLDRYRRREWSRQRRAMWSFMNLKLMQRLGA